MVFRLASLKPALLLAVVAGAAVFPAQAQRAKARPGQPILFSSPDSGTIFSNLPALATKPPGSPNFNNALEAPASFDFNEPVVSPPPGGPVISRAEAARLQEQFDKRKNWILMTPAEILGVTTPEKMMGIQEHDAAGRPKNLTALERYNERQNQAMPVNPDTNALPAWLAPDKASDILNLIPEGLGNTGKVAGLLFNPVPDDQSLAGQTENDRWTRLFGPAPLSASPPPQPTDMERFRQLLKTGNPPSPAVTPSLSGVKAPLPQSALSSGIGQSALTPVGATFTPLSSGIGKPAELPKLPSIWSLSITSPPSAAVWAPQPPPWLAPTPEPFAAPQRKF